MGSSLEEPELALSGGVMMHWLSREAIIEECRALALGMDMSSWTVSAEDLWEVLGGSPELSWADKRALLHSWPLVPLSSREETLATLYEIRGDYERRYGDPVLIERLYQAVLSGRMRDVRDLDGAAAAAAETGERRLEAIALVACWDEDETTEQRVARLERALELAPGVASLWHNLGLQYLSQGRHQRALEAFERVLAIRPDSEVTLCRMGRVLEEESGQPEAAEALYRRATEVAPDYAPGWVGLGSLLAGLGRAAEAERALRAALALDGERAVLWELLGDLLKEPLHRYSQAEAAYRRAAELDPADSSPWRELADLYSRCLGRPGAAVSALRRVLAAEPDDPWAHNALGNLLAHRPGGAAEAEGCYREAIALAPGVSVAWYNLGRLLRQQPGRQLGAAEALGRAAELGADRAGIWLEYGAALHDLERYAEAEAAYRRALALRADQASGWNSLALVCMEQGRSAEAVEHCREALRCDPEYGPALNNLAWALFTLDRDLGEAEAASARAVALEPGNPFSLHTRAAVLLRLGRWGEAAPAVRALITCPAAGDLDSIWDDVLALFEQAAAGGYAAEALALLEGADERWSAARERLTRAGPPGGE